MTANAKAEEGRTKPEVQFAMVPIDVLMAFGRYHGGTQGAVHASALASTYGVAKKAVFPIDRKAIARATGATPQAVRTAISRLCRAGILARTGDGFHHNRRYSQWAGTAVEVAREIYRFAKGRKACQNGHDGQDEPCQDRHKPCPTRHKPCPTRHETCPTRHETCQNGHAPLKREERETPEYLSQSASEDGTTARFFPDPEPIPPPPPKLHPSATPEVRGELVAKADAVKPGWGYECGKALLAGADPDHLREAIARADRATTKPRSWNYVQAILDDFKAGGIPKPIARRKPGSPEFLAEFRARYEANCRKAEAEDRERAERGAVA
jgi:hypothetical protein